MKYALIRRNRHLWPIRVPCRVWGVSGAGDHEHFGRQHTMTPRRPLSEEVLLAHIRAIYAETRGADGWPRIWRQLKRQGIRVGKQRVQQLMQPHSMRARGRRRFRISTTDSRHALPVADNRLNRQFSVVTPKQAWVGDITYIATSAGWLFLAVVMELFNRQVVGWALQEERRSELVMDAFRMAWLQRQPGRNAGLLLHSDRGSQYAGQPFQQMLRDYGVQCSMSRQGTCWDNACSETLFGSLKVERLHGQRFETRRQAKDEVLPWLFWYNRKRLHSSLQYQSPIEYEQSGAHQAITRAS